MHCTFFVCLLCLHGELSMFGKERHWLQGIKCNWSPILDRLGNGKIGKFSPSLKYLPKRSKIVLKLLKSVPAGSMSGVTVTPNTRTLPLLLTISSCSSLSSRWSHGIDNYLSICIIVVSLGSSSMNFFIASDVLAFFKLNLLWGSYTILIHLSVHTTIGCGKQGFPSAQPYLSHTPVS